MKGNKILQTILMIIAVIIFEGFFILIAPILWSPQVAYNLWGRSGTALLIGGVIIMVYSNKKKKK